jgi:hypothetical protein
VVTNEINRCVFRKRDEIEEGQNGVPRLKWAGHIACMGVKKNPYRIVVGNPEGKRPLRRPRHRWEDNIKLDLRERGWCGVDGIDLSEDRPVEGPCEHGNELLGPVKCSEILE